MQKTRMGKWRALVLVGIHLLFIAHLLHWFSVREHGGKTLSPVEPSEAMYTIEQGQLNAGFVMLAVALAATLLLGRWFCGWACHVVALQDGCAWLLRRVGIRPKPFRSRLLMWAPLFFGLYMFVWPTFKREVWVPLMRKLAPSYADWLGPQAAFTGFSDHLMTEDFWATFPSQAWVIVLFLGICGFAAVYFLGAKGFCTYGCPYGGLFAVVDKFSPGQIKANLDACEGCGHCTATCTSNVRVHEEIQVHSRVVDPGCMKCMDCVSVCPNDALSFGFAKPAALSSKSERLQPPPARKYDLRWGEEILLALFFAGSFLGFRGLYRTVPLLMAIGMAGCATFVVWMLWRSFNDENLRLQPLQIKRDGKFTAAGIGFFAVGALTFLFTVHSGLVRYHYNKGEWHDQRVQVPEEAVFGGISVDSLPPIAREHARAGLYRYEQASAISEGGIGLMSTPSLLARRAWLHLVLGERGEAQALLERDLEAGSADEHAADNLARVLLLQEKYGEAEKLLVDQLAQHPESFELRNRICRLYATQQRFDEAEQVWLDYLSLKPEHLAARRFLATTVYFPANRLADAERELASVLQITPDDPSVLHEYSMTLYRLGARDEALQHLTRASQIDPMFLDALEEMRTALDPNAPAPDDSGSTDISREDDLLEEIRRGD